MSKIIDYTVVMNDTDQAKIRLYLSKGWIPFGGLTHDGNYLVQPMVKYDTDSLNNASALKGASALKEMEDALNDTKEAFNIVCANEKKLRGALETLQSTYKWTYEIIFATIVLFCILAFTGMIMIYNEYQTELCLY